MEAGHAGASGRFERLKEVALAYAFALKIAGNAPGWPPSRLCHNSGDPGQINPHALARDKSQLLIIDVQDKLLAAVSGQERVIERCVRLIDAAKALGVPITVSEQYPAGLGPTAEPIRAALGNAGPILDKIEFSCVRNEALRERLHDIRRRGRPQVVIGGLEAHVCVTQTAIDLEEQGFEAFVVADAVGSRSKTTASPHPPAQGRRRRGRQRDGAVRVARTRRHAGVQGAARL